MIEPYQQRVFDEKDQLVRRIRLLEDFMDSKPASVWGQGEAKDYQLMADQLRIMQEYKSILTKRIERFTVNKIEYQE